MSKKVSNLRKSLSKGGYLNKRINYASGEVILTIVSILLAIQINNWNQNRVDRNEVMTIIGNLYDEFEQNRTNLNNRIKALDKPLNTSLHLIKLIGKSKTELQQYNLDSLIAQSLQYKKFSPSEDVLLVLVQSGKLELVKNDSIRDLIYAWSSNRISLHENFEELDKNMSKVIDYLTVNYSLRNFDVYSSGKQTGPSNLTVDKYKIFQELAFENHIQNHIYYLSTYIKGLEETGGIINEITAFSKRYDK